MFLLAIIYNPFDSILLDNASDIRGIDSLET